MAVMLVLAFVLVWPRTPQPLTGTALALIVALAPATWLAFRTANVASAVALGVSLSIVGHRRRSTGVVAIGLLLAGIAKILPAVPLVLWLIVKHREWRLTPRHLGRIDSGLCRMPRAPALWFAIGPARCAYLAEGSGKQSRKRAENPA